MYRTAFLGCGPRANGHADAYTRITRGKPVACCDLNPERLSAFAEKHGIPAVYSDLDVMLKRERPDVVHLVTPPTLRTGLMTRLAEAGVPGVIVEKPICIGADDYKVLRRLSADSATRFVVNHQLRHHPRIVEMLAEVRDGAIGDVRCIDASARLPMSGQGVHVLDLACAFAAYPPPESVFAAASGYDDINGTHPSPRDAAAMIDFTGGIRALLQAGAGAPVTVPGAPVYMNKRVAIYGTNGFRAWTMAGWEKGLPDGTVERGDHEYRVEDVYGQGGLTNALFDWLEDDSCPSPTRLDVALDEWLIILALYASVVDTAPVSFPFDPPDDLLDRLKRHLGA